MNRRGFLKIFATAAPTYFLPPICGWKSDIIEQPTISNIIEYGKGPITYSDLISGNESRYIHLTYGLSVKIAREILEESNLDKLLRQKFNVHS